MKVKVVVATMISLGALWHSSFALNTKEISAFTKGKTFIQNNDTKGYEASLAELKDTRVAPYLQYYYVQQNFKKLPRDVVLKFIQNNSKELFASSLTNDFYRYELGQKEYGFIIEQLHDTSTQYLRCIYDDAILKTSPKSFDAQKFQSYWVKVSTPLSTCLPVEKVWLDKYASVEVIDKKINELIRNLQLSRAKVLLPYLNEAKKKYYESMIQIVENPSGQLMKQKKYFQDSSAFYALAVRQWGKNDSTSALKGLDFIQKNKLVSNADYVALRNLLAVFQAGRSDAIDPLGRIQSIPKAEQGDDVKISGFKLNAQAGNCSAALDYLARLSPKAQEDATWIYWQGRMHQCLNNDAKAAEFFQKIAGQTSFYGFLSADELKKSYSVLDSIVKRKTDKPEPLTDRSFLVALDLMAVDETGFANQAWQQGLRNASNGQKNSASFIAYDKGYYDLGIRAGVAARMPGALHIRYPMGYEKEVNQAGKLYGYPTELLWGLIRQESLFQPNARSHANAYGLMQLLIPTAEKMAQKLGEKRGSLYDPVYNIRYGSAYLNDVSGIVGESWPYILASYNAGPHKVKNWINPPMDDIVLWIESIPYKETRGYVKSILENAVIYHYQKGKPVRVTEYLDSFYPK